MRRIRLEKTKWTSNQKAAVRLIASLALLALTISVPGLPLDHGEDAASSPEGNASPLKTAAAAKAIETITNGVYNVNVVSRDSNTSRIGSWNAVTAVNHATGSGNDLLFQGNNPTTNFSSLRVYHDAGFNDYSFGGRGGAMNLDDFVANEVPSPLVPTGRGWRTIWNIGTEDLEVTQDVVIVGTDTNNSAIYHTVEIQNTGDVPSRVGWRNLYDWQISEPGRDDGPNNQLETVCGTILQGATTRAFRHYPVTAQIVRVSVDPGTPTYQPLLGLTFDPGFRSDLPVTPPDEYAYVNWRTARQTAFDHTVRVGTDVTRDSAGLSWFGRDETRAIVIAPGASVRLTQVIFAEIPGECQPGCLQTAREKVLCSTDGSDTFTYELILRNTSQFDIYEIELSGLPAGLTISPDTATFDPPIRPNRSRRLLLTIQNAEPGQIVSFTLTARNQRGNYVCSLEKSIQMPLCDCAQLLSVRPPSCFPTLGGLQAYTLRFDLQNLFSETVHRLVLTPEEPSTATFNPNVFTLSQDPLEFAESSDFASRVRGASPGERVCVRISTHDSTFDECCSIVQCFTMPRCNDFRDFETVGSATLDFTENGLVLRNLGSGGNDGVRVDLDNAIRWDGEWLPLEGSNFFVLEDNINGFVDGQPDQPLFSWRATAEGDSVSLEADFSPVGARTQTFAMYLRGERVGTVDQVPTAIPFFTPIQTDAHHTLGGIDRFGGTPAEFEGLSCDPRETTTQRCTFAGFTFKESFPFAFRSFEGVIDEIVVIPEQVEADIGPLTSVTLQAGGVASRTLTAIDISFDCNQNGVPDFDDILAHVSSDGDRNGIPDECQKSCIAGPRSLCLNRGRFEVEVAWKDFAGNSGTGKAAELTGDTGYFYFFDENNVELVVKILDGRTVNDHFWFFYGALSNVEYTVTVTDVETGAKKTYFNPAGELASVADVKAFTDDGVQGAFAIEEASGMVKAVSGIHFDLPLAEPGPGAGSKQGSCVPDMNRLCLRQDRFQVEIAWEDFEGNSGPGRAEALTEDTGYFWFFDEGNVEVMLKVLDGTAVNGRFWVFFGALSDVEYTVTVTDTVTGAVKTWFNPLGQLTSIGDTTAF